MAGERTQVPLNLFLPLKDGHFADVADLLRDLDAHGHNPVHKALRRLGNVHGAQFVLLSDLNCLAVLTTYDGDFDDYIMSFVEAIGDIFDKILLHVEGWSGTASVRTRSAEFLAFLKVHDRRSLGRFSAYPAQRVFDVRAALNPPPAEPSVAPGVVAAQLPDLSRVQSLVLTAPRHDHLRYHFFTITDPAAARLFIHEFAGGTFAVRTGSDRSEAATPEYYFAVTAVGLHTLGVALDSFPKAFTQGAKARALSLGDRGPSAPQHWTMTWHDEVDFCVIVYAESLHVLGQHSSRVVAEASKRGCKLAAHLDGRSLESYSDRREPDQRRREHFGFADGISQPRLQGIFPPKAGEEQVPVGMFVLGHPDAGDPLGSVRATPVPSPDVLGFDGTFGAFRMMEQDRRAFDQFLDSNSTPANRALVAAKLCGRYSDGRPLADPALPPGANGFDYANDPSGQRCPVGAHIRRAYPRASATMGDAGHRARLVRRGMTYGPPFETEPEAKRGVLGMFLCADLEHQYEFVLKNWINDGMFAPELRPGETDPLVGTHPTGTTFRYAGNGSVTSYEVPQFVTTRGALYLFFPGRQGIEYLGDASARRPAHASPDDLFINTIDKNVRASVMRLKSRDAHPKHHGLLRAEFEVLDVPAEFRHGVFATPRKYKAYIRFSNGTPPRGGHDAVPDARGMAIKLFDVAGPKLLDDERWTQDFILVSHPTFFVRDLSEYLRFQSSPKHPAILARDFPLVLPSFRSINNPLTTAYFSQTAYALGDSQGATLAVKYSATPVQPAREEFLDAAEIERRLGGPPDFLQAALFATLRQQDAVFDFRVQSHDGRGGPQVDDPTVDWHSSWTPVARITIKAGQTLSTRQLEFAERISYNPWHALPAHQPLGPFNAARKVVYLTSRQLRHQLNGMAHVEPTGTESF